ncbi:CLCA_X family protein [Gallaecimonas sp. GXIMD1310]|uniref:CLCA_X family protein n=1 Tax=Gallaecimonas sp. GXIMD1310 TaxID=3131926 RepID=UPI00324379C7
MQPDNRRGPDFRLGEDRTFADVRDQFALAGVRIGRWVSRDEQAAAANRIFDALADLAWVLQVPPWLLGLRGQLQLVYGSRGQLGVQAHYEANTRILALAKHAGAGALAHEFWHAFDHHIASKLYPDAGPREMASQLWLAQDHYRAHPLNDALVQVFRTALLSPDGRSASAFMQRALALDESRGRSYFSQPTEMLARAFEAFVQDHAEIHNPYLVSGTKKSAAAKAGAFPQGQERTALAAAFRQYFKALGQALV